MSHAGPNVIQDNIFLAIEAYLAHPSSATIKKIKTIAQSIDQNFGDDLPGLQGKQAAIMTQAASAFPHSMRLIENNVTDRIPSVDPAYIFKITETQYNQIKQLMPINDYNSAFSMALRSYLERKGRDVYVENDPTRSIFHYCQLTEAATYDHNALLFLKAQDLDSRGQSEAASTLRTLCKDIKVVCAEHGVALINPTTTTDGLTALKKVRGSLELAYKDEILSTHRGCKELLINFLIAISVVGLAALAVTANTRGSFWYHPNTDTQNKIQDFSDTLGPNNP